MTNRAADELRECDDDELENRLELARKELFNLRFQVATGRLDNVSRIRQVRRDVARSLTVQRDREIREAEGEYTPTNADIVDTAPVGIPGDGSGKLRRRARRLAAKEAAAQEAAALEAEASSGEVDDEVDADEPSAPPAYDTAGSADDSPADAAHAPRAAAAAAADDANVDDDDEVADEADLEFGNELGGEGGSGDDESAGHAGAGADGDAGEESAAAPARRRLRRSARGSSGTEEE